MLGWEYPPRVAGGLGVACAGLVRGLRESGVDVVLVLPSASAGARRRIRRRGGVGSLEIVPAFAGRGRGRNGARGAALAAASKRVDPYASVDALPTRGAARTRGGGVLYGPDLVETVERYASAAGEIAARRRFDVVHAHDWLTFPAGLAAKQASNRPLVAHVHATELDRSGPAGAGSPAALIERRALPVADRVVAVSRYTAGVLRERYGVCADRIRVVHNAIDAVPSGRRGQGRRARRRGSPLVLFAGRVTRQKGPEQFVRAAALVASERPDVRFVLAGTGDRLEEVRDEASLLRIGERIRFTGFVSRGALDRLYARADVFVMPSLSEPFGLVALEALARGTPAIISRTSGVGEVLPRVLRVDFGDVEELAAKILWVLALPGLRDSLSAAGVEAVGRLSWRAAGERCAAIYSELAADAAGGGTIAAP